MREGLADESKRLDVKRERGEAKRGTRKKNIPHLVTTATRKQLIGVCVSESVGLISVADKWPNTSQGERNILTIISCSFPFISSDMSVAPVLHHNKMQHSNPLMVKPP